VIIKDARSRSAERRLAASSSSWLGLWCFVALLCACRGERRKPVFNEEAIYLRTPVPAEDSLSSTVFGSTDIVARPWMIGANDRLVIVSDLKPPFLHVFDATTGRHIKSLGSLGEGPGEFSSAPSLMRGGLWSDTLWVLDGPRRRISGVLLAQLQYDSLTPEFAMFGVDSVQTFTADGPNRKGDFFGLADSRTSGHLPLAIHSMNSRATIGPVRDMADDRIEPSYRGRAYLGRVCYAPRENLVVQIFNFTGRIDFLDMTGKLIREAEVPFRYLPFAERDTSRNNEVTFRPGRSRVRWAYYDCAATDRFVYALYDGRRMVPDSASPPPFGEVHVFDWYGALVRTLVLDHRTTGLAVPTGDSVIFTIIEDSLGSYIRRTAVRWK
jgi:hypothetical protein